MDRKTKTEDKKRMKTMKRLSALILAALLLSACGKTEPSGSEEPVETAPAVSQTADNDPAGTDPAETAPVETEAPGTDPAAPELTALSKTISIVQPASYAEVYKKLTVHNNRGYGRYYASGMAVDEDVAEEAMVEAPAPEPMAADTAGNFAVEKAAAPEAAMEAGADYSETNTQVQGIDEADIVKTDGTYIYALFDNELRIYTAAGADTALISRTTAGNEADTLYYKNTWDWADAGKSEYSSWKSPMEMFILGDTAVILSNCSEYASGEVNGEWRYEDKSYVLADFYDISDRTNPVLTNSEGQDGYYQSSRLMDGKLYLITNQYSYRWYDIAEENPADYVPSLYRGGVAEPVAPDRICWPETTEDSSYTVVARYDVTGRQMEDSLSILGAGNTFYMSKNYLYLADTRYFEDMRNEFDESIYHVQEFASGNRTEILKLTFADAIRVETTGTVDGNLLNQFSMDEYNGSLRVVTTSWNSNYQIWRDEERDFTNWKYLESGQTNALWVFDEGMNLVGSVTDVAPGEQVYSVRFDGEVGYFVTFRQVDPLFAVNLSDPANPQIMSALKIPGFSRYMHPWSDGLLFGLGQDADEETGRTNTMKLSMFDTSDPYNVFERDKLILESTYSEALYNHKAILIAPAKGVIGFPTDNGYTLYHYDPETGFTKTNEVTLNDNWYWSWNTRGLYVGDTIYIVAEQGVTVLDLITGDFITTVYN